MLEPMLLHTGPVTFIERSNPSLSGATAICEGLVMKPCGFLHG